MVDTLQLTKEGKSRTRNSNLRERVGFLSGWINNQADLSSPESAALEASNLCMRLNEAGISPQTGFAQMEIEPEKKAILAPFVEELCTTLYTEDPGNFSEKLVEVEE